MTQRTVRYSSVPILVFACALIVSLVAACTVRTPSSSRVRGVAVEAETALLAVYDYYNMAKSNPTWAARVGAVTGVEGLRSFGWHAGTRGRLTVTAIGSDAIMLGDMVVLWRPGDPLLQPDDVLAFCLFAPEAMRRDSDGDGLYITADGMSVVIDQRDLPGYNAFVKGARGKIEIVFPRK